MMEAQKGRRHSDETKKKISESQKKRWAKRKNRRLSEEHKKKISEGLKKRWTKRKSIDLENDKTRD